MRKLILVLVSMLLIVCGCVNQSNLSSDEDGKEVEVMSEPSGQLSQKFEPTLSSISAFMDYSKDQVLEYLGKEYTIVMAGAEGLEDGYYYEEYGITLLFEYNEPYRVMRVECADTISIQGARLGMTFKEIKEILGKGESFKAEDGEYIGRYYLNYHLCNRLVQFGAPKENASTDYLEIRRDYMSE